MSKENSEYSNYLNTMTAHNADWQEYEIWFANNYEPANGRAMADIDSMEGEI